MKCNRYMVLIIIVLLSIAMLAGCAQPQTSIGLKGGGWVSAPWRGDGVFSDEGYYYLSEHNCLCFLDVENGINVVLCSKVGCPHDNSTEDENGEQVFCEAYIIGELQFFWEGKIYYTIEDDYGLFLYRRNADGTAEERVMQLCAEYMDPDQSLHLSACYFLDGIMYYQVDTSSIGFEGTHINYEIQNKLLMRLDLQTGREEEVYSDSSEAVPGVLGIREDGLIYSVLVIDPEYFKLEISDPKREEYYKDSRQQIIYLDVRFGKKQLIMEKHFSETLGVQNVSGETLLYSIKEDDQQVLRSLNLTTGEDTLLLARDIVYINDCFCFTYEGEDEKLTLMDMQTSQLLPTAYQDITLYPKDIGEKGMIMVRYLKTEGNASRTRIYSYVAFADLKDGLQEEDFVDFFVR